MGACMFISRRSLLLRFNQSPRLGTCGPDFGFCQCGSHMRASSGVGAFRSRWSGSSARPLRERCERRLRHLFALRCLLTWDARSLVFQMKDQRSRAFRQANHPASAALHTIQHSHAYSACPTLTLRTTTYSACLRARVTAAEKHMDSTLTL